MPLIDLGPATETQDKNLIDLGPAEDVSRETSITQVGVLDNNTLMADGFDMEKHIGPEKSAQLDLIGDKNEVLSDLKISAFLQNMGIQPDNINACDVAARALLNEDTSAGLWDSFKEGWNNGLIDLQSGDTGMAFINRQITPEQTISQIDTLEKNRQETKSKNWVGSWFKAGSGVLPTMLETSSHGARTGLVTGGGAALTALVGGQIGPQAALPEEAITVPGAFAIFGGVGFQIGSAKREGEIEAGMAATEMLKMTDDQGNRIDPEIIRSIADKIGAINGLLGQVQILDIIKTIPGGKKLLARATNKTIKNLVLNKSIVNVLAKGAAKYAGHIGIETGTEVLQKADNIIFTELAKNISNEMDKTSFAPAAKKDIVKQLVSEAVNSAKAFSLIAAPGTVIQTGGEALAVPKPPTKAVAGQTAVGATQTAIPGTEPVERISRIMASEKIIPRLDINSLGKTLVDVPVELPTKEPRIVTKKEVVLTPEEEYQIQQSEATLKAEEPFSIKPELYIGNVTARMKEVFGEEWDSDPEQIQGFHEGAWPTKRTKITLKMDEARALLVQMETSLQERVDNNQLNTDSDLARANADWGDIKEIRKKLGLPKTLRPFRVIRETGTRITTIENTRERIKKTTEAGALDVVKMTEIERLDAVLKRVAKAAKEGWVGGKKEAKQQYALLQYLRKQKQLRDKLIDKIKKEPSDKINFFYREAIAGLQNAIDWKIKTEGKKQKKESLRDFLNRNPDKASEIPTKLLETLGKKDVNNLSYNDLLLMNNEIARLKQLGELKSEEIRAKRAEAIEKEATEMAAIVKKAPVGIFQKALAAVGQEKIAQVERALGLRPMRIFDMLDGGKNFAGRIYTFFYKHTNEDFNTELQNRDQRQQGGKRRMDELGISMKSLLQKRTIGDHVLSVDEMMSVYTGWKNAKTRATMMYGGLEIASSKDPMLVDEALYQKITDELTENEKTWGDTVIAEYTQNSYERLRNTVIAAENRDMGTEENYTPMIIADKEHKTTEQELLDEIALRHYFRPDGPHKGFTIPRKDVPAEFRRPIKSGLTKIWLQSVQKQEHYINNALHIKDMQAMINREDFQKAITDKFGDPILETVRHFVKMIANPDYYKSYNDLENLSKVGRRHVAIAFIAFRLPSMLNQIPAIMSYWASSSFNDILVSAMDSATHPMETYEKAKEIHYQISHQSIEREMEELQIADNSAYEKIVAEVGTIGMFGLVSLDRATRVIGINAVYNKAIRDGLSVKEAREKAVNVTLMTQEASTPKDLARLYSSNEIINWFTMFTNQLNQIYNITTYDIPAAWRNKNYREASRSAISLATMAMMIWMIQERDIPDEPEDALQAVAEQFVGSIPLFGSYLVSGVQGWNASAPAPLESAAKAAAAVVTGYEGDPEKMLLKLLEPISVISGMPYQAVKEAYQFIEESE